MLHTVNNYTTLQGLTQSVNTNFMSFLSAMKGASVIDQTLMQCPGYKQSSQNLLAFLSVYSVVDYAKKFR